MICGDETENRIEKSEYGSYTSVKDYKKDYKLELPVCDECNSKINLKAGKSGIMLVLGVLLGISLGIIVYYITYSIILSVAVFTVLVIFPFLKYRIKIRPRIKLSDFLQMRVIPNQEFVQFTFINKEYARYVNRINSEKIKEKKKSETVEKTAPLGTGKKCPKCGSTIKSSWKFCVFCSEDITDSDKPSTKEIRKIKEEIGIPVIKVIHPETKKCPKCGSNLKPGWKFCVFCSEVIKD